MKEIEEEKHDWQMVITDSKCTSLFYILGMGDFYTEDS